MMILLLIGVCGGAIGLFLLCCCLFGDEFVFFPVVSLLEVVVVL